MAVSTAFPPSRVARGVAIETQYRDMGAGGASRLPSLVGVVGQGNDAVTYSTTPKQVFSAAEAAGEYGWGSPIHLAVAAYFAQPGAVGVPCVVYPVEAAGGAVASAGSITASGGPASKAQSYRVRVGGIDCGLATVAEGGAVADVHNAIVAAVSGTLSSPVDAAVGTGTVDITAKWSAANGDDLVVSVTHESGPQDFTFVVAQPTGGAGNPDVAAALANVGDDWVTHVVNACGNADAILDAYQTWVESRWDPEVYHPAVAISATAETSVSTITTLTDARGTDRANVLVCAPGSETFTASVAGAAGGNVAVRANLDTAYDYARMPLNGVLPGLASQQFTSAQRDTLVKAGASTTELRGGQVVLSDVVTMYHPAGEEPPAYRYVCDIAKLSNVIYATANIFSTGWPGAPLVPDGQPTSNPRAKKPSMALAQLADMYRSLASAAIISDPDFAIENTTASIDSANPKRLNVEEVFKLSGNANVISITQWFGFYVGE